MRNVKLILSVVFCLLVNEASAQYVVKIYVYSGGGVVEEGTGFFCDEAGQIITAYHVVHGANRLEITHEQLGIFPEVRVEFLAPEYDLAILRLNNLLAETPFLPLSKAVPQAGEELIVVGYPQQIGPSQEILARATNSNLANSLEIRTNRGERLFARGIDVITLDLTVYGGMSGAPLIREGNAVGVLSASFNEGGAIGWAIPVKYIEQMQGMGSLSPNQVPWPPFEVMSNVFRSAKRLIRVDEEGERLLHEFFRIVGELQRVYKELRSNAVQIQANASVNRIVLQNIQQDIQVYDRETIGELLEYPVMTLMEQFERYGKLNTQYGNTMLNLGSKLSELQEWMIGDAGVPPTLIEAFDNQIVKLNQQYQVLAGGYHESIGADSTAENQIISVAMQFFRLAKEGSMAQALGALDRFIEGVDVVTRPHASVQALKYTGQDIQRWRSVGATFEPAVYRRIGSQ